MSISTEPAPRSALPFALAEYERRWASVREAAARDGLAGVVVFSRGGGQTDSYADVLYLANHYVAFPLLADQVPHWSGHSHCALVFGPDGEPTLVHGFGEYRQELVAVEDVRVSPDVPDGVRAVLDEKGLLGERIGLAGANAMLAGPYARLKELVAAELVPFDGAIETIRVRKSPAELDALRAAAEVGEEIMRAILRTAARGGCTEAEAISEGYRLAVREGVALYDAATASGPFASRYTYGRLPSWSRRPLEDGDLFHVDLYGTLDGYMFDFSRTTVVGREPSGEQREVLEGVAESIESSLAALAPGMTGAAVFELVRGKLVERGLADPPTPPGEAREGFAGYECHGHNLGLFWEWPWLTPWETRELETSMLIAIECMAGTPEVGLAKLELNAIIEDGGPQPLLTLPAVCTADRL
jgi:Xaa-Pro aminopeptidase